MWAFAKVFFSEAPLFVLLARTVNQHVEDFNAQALANMAWAFATARHSDLSLFAALARSSEWCAGAFKPQELANMAWV